MNRGVYFVLCVFLGLLAARATDPAMLRGCVRDTATGEPVAGVIVKVKGAFTSTDKEGCFSLIPKADADSVSFRCMGYESLRLPVSVDLSDVRLIQKATQLNDVIVKAPDIYAKGDTLVFNVARYANAKDDAIIDVIKRLPGIKVEDDGTIKYQGKPINKFYIDGNDFIGGQYGLATNNISHKDVKSVEVMENHQPVKALEGIDFPEEAGINLRLKDNARSRWVGVAQAVAGVYPVLYDGSLFTMRMAPKIQNMFTLKADNTGWNPENEIRDHDFDAMFTSDYVSSLWPDYISADNVNVPLSEKRTRDNLSWLADAITAWKSGDTSMRLKLDYIGDRLDYASGIVTDYLDPQIPTFVQNNSQQMQHHCLSAQLFSVTNKRDYYLKDKFTISGAWDRSNSAITGSYDIIQHVKRKNFTAVNDLKLVKRNDKRLFTLASRNSFGHRPERLLIFGDEDPVQTVGTTDFRSTTEIRFGKLSRFWKVYLTGGLDIDCHRMDSRLSGLGVWDNCGVYDAFLSNVFASPQVDYDRNGWRMSVSAPLKWYHYSINGQHDYVNLSPRFNVRRQLTAKSELSGIVTYKLGSPQAYLNIDVAILSDYRNLFIGANPDKYTQDVATSLSYCYRNPIKSLFINLSATYDYRRSLIMPNQLFVEDFIISTYADRISHSRMWLLKGSVSQGLGHSKMVAGLEVDVSVRSASSMRDNVFAPYDQRRVEVKPYFKGRILRWLSINYEAACDFSDLTVNEIKNDYHVIHQTLFTTVIPDDIVHFTFGAEHFLTRFPEGDTASLVLLDASAVWIVNSNLRLSLTGSNLLNEQRYEYVTYGAVCRSQHRFNLRPCSILASVQYRF